MLCSGWVIFSTPSYEFLNDTLYDKRQSVGIWVRLVRSFQGSWGWDMRGGGSEGDKFFREDSLWILWGLKDSLWTIILDSNHYKLAFLCWEDHWIYIKWSDFFVAYWMTVCRLCIFWKYYRACKYLLMVYGAPLLTAARRNQMTGKMYKQPSVHQTAF